VLQTLRGSDGRDLAVVDAPFDWQPKLGVKGLRVGVIQSEFDRLKDDMKKVLDQALADLRSTGTDLKPVELPKFDFAPLRVILSAEAATAFDDLTRNGGVNQLKGQTPGDWPNSFRTSQMIPAVEYIRAQRARTLVIERFEKFMADWDVIVIPPQQFLTTTNLTGNPEVVTKCGFVNNRPLEIGFLGKIYDEGSPLRVALAYEQATEWHKKNPPALGV
jgi:Asp-tRNA(Asn)/Glu-tRNA(Gln) amidotransferase A subunit family amidase